MTFTFLAIFLIQILQISCANLEIKISGVDEVSNSQEYGFRFILCLNEAFPNNNYANDDDFLIIKGIKVKIGGTEKTVDCLYTDGNFVCLGSKFDTSSSDEFIIEKNEIGYEVDYSVGFEEKGKILIKVPGEVPGTIDNNDKINECDLGYELGKCLSCGGTDETKTNCDSCFVEELYALSTTDKTKCYVKCSEDYDLEDPTDPTSIKSGACEVCGKVGDQVFTCFKCLLKTDDLVDGKCVPNCLGLVKGCSECDKTNLTLCTACVEGYELEDDTCEKESSITFMKIGLFSLLLIALMF